MINFGGTGSVSIAELLTFPGGSSQTLDVSLGGSASASLTFAGVPSILVEKDMFLGGGSLGANVTFVNQGFSSSSNVVPEPASVTLALIGAGLAGLAGWRQRRKHAPA
jgi:hypothetical protein